MLKANKLRFLISFISILLFLSITSCDGTVSSAVRVRVSAIAFKQKDTNIKNGEEIDISTYLNVFPEDAINKKVRFEAVTENFSTYAVLDSKTGKIKAKAVTPAGGLQVKAISLDNNSAVDTCRITISPILVSDVVIYLDEADKVMEVGDERDLKAKAFPENCQNSVLTYHSTNPEVVSVSTNGHMIARAVGNATISVLSTDGSNIYDQVVIAVTKKIIPCTDIELANNIGENGLSAPVNEMINLPVVGTDIIFVPSNTTTTTVSFYITDTSYATQVSAEGGKIKILKNIPAETDVYLVIKANDKNGIEKRVRLYSK